MAVIEGTLEFDAPKENRCREDGSHSNRERQRQFSSSQLFHRLMILGAETRSREALVQ